MKWILAALLLSHGAPAAPQTTSEADDESPREEIRPLDEPARAADQPVPGAAQALSAALSRAIARGWQDLHLLARCPPSRQPQSLELFGSGVGVWNNSSQFRIPSETIKQILSVLLDSGFAEMPSAFGGQPAPLGRSPKITSAGAEVACQISLQVDDQEKTVIQLRKGPQSTALRDLAGAVLELAQGHARNAVAPAGLEDALARVASGELAPELLSVSIHRKPRAGQDGRGWLLAVRRQSAETRPFVVGAGYGERRRVRLEAEEVRALAALLARQGVATMPPNLWSEIYTDFDFAVMRWRKSIQARDFDGLAPEDLGDQQKAFEQLLESLSILSLRISSQASGPSG